VSISFVCPAVVTSACGCATNFCFRPSRTLLVLCGTVAFLGDSFFLTSYLFFVCINQFINFKVSALLGLLLALSHWRVCKRLSECFAFCHARENANANSSAVCRETHKIRFENRKAGGGNETRQTAFDWQCNLTASRAATARPTSFVILSH